MLRFPDKDRPFHRPYHRVQWIVLDEFSRAGVLTVSPRSGFPQTLLCLFRAPARVACLSRARGRPRDSVRVFLAPQNGLLGLALRAEDGRLC